MTVVDLRQAEIRGWRGYQLSCGDVCLGVAPGIGGRIISMLYRGQELLFAQPEHLGELVTLDMEGDLRQRKRQLGFRLWGGDKTWVAPQEEWWEGIPPLDLDAGRYVAETQTHAVVLESPICRETGLRLRRRIELEPDARIVLDQEIVNEGATPAARGIWNVTQCLRPFDVYIAAPVGQIKAYAGEGDSVRLAPELLIPHEEWTCVPCRGPVHFKYGARSRRGVVVALRHDEEATLAFVREFETDPAAAYAHDASVEVYNSPRYDYLEIEVHAPLRELAPGGGSASHRQLWKLGRLPGMVGPSQAAEILLAGR